MILGVLQLSHVDDAQLAAAHPLRILVAEDNVVYQKLAVRLLGQMATASTWPPTGWRPWKVCCARPTTWC